MRTLLQYAMRGRWHAILVATGFFALTGLLVFGTGSGAATDLPLLLAGVTVYASGAVIALAGLRFGFQEGAIVAGGALVAASLLSVTAGLGVQQVIAFAVLNWLPALIASHVLRGSSDQGQAFAVIAILATLGWFGMVTVLGQPTVVFEPLAKAIWPGVAASITPPGEAPPELGEQGIAALSKALGWTMLASQVFGVALTVLLARWWHALLDNPGGFGKEFRALRLPRWVALGVGVSVVIGTVTSGMIGAVAGGFIAVALALFNFQGVALAHGLVAIRKAPRGWLVAFYAFYVFGLLVPPYSPLLVAMAGFADTLFDYRRRASRQ